LLAVRERLSLINGVALPGSLFQVIGTLACRGTRWHHIELQYPRSEKRRMDATVTAIARGMTHYHDDCPRN